MKKVLILFCFIVLYSCSNEFDNVENSETLFLNKNLVMNSLERENDLKSEMTLLTSRVLNSRDARQEVTNFVNVVDTIYKTVSISALLKRQDNLSYLEEKNLDYLNDNLSNLLPDEYFKRNVLFELRRSGATDYPTLTENLDMNRASDTQIVEQLVSYDLSLFFPDLDLFDWSQINSFKSTFVPTTENGENQALLVGTLEIGNTDNLDVCTCTPESPGGLTLVEGDDFTEDFATIIIDGTSHDVWDDNYFTVEDLSGNSPPPVTNPTVLLDYNFNYYQMPNTDYLLTSGIPRMRVTDGWRRWGSPSTRLRIYRAKSSFSVNSNGEIVAQEDHYMQGYNPSRYATRKKRWRSVNIEWDPNVKQEEKSQQIVIFQQRNGASSATASFSTENNIDSNGAFSTTNTTSLSQTINHNQSYLRVSRELDLFNLGVYNVNGNPHHGNETRNYDGVEQTVLIMDKVRLFFEFNYTDLSD